MSEQPLNAGSQHDWLEKRVIAQLFPADSATQESQVLGKLGNVDGITRSLQTSPQSGIPGTEEDLKLRRKRYGKNVRSKRQIRPISSMFSRALDDFLLKVIFLVASIIIFVGVAKDGTEYGY